MRAHSIAPLLLGPWLVASPLEVVAQESVTDPNRVMQLSWEIGSWKSLWNTATLQSDVVGEEVSYYIYLPPAYAADVEARFPVLVWLHGARSRAYSASPIVERLDAAIRNGETAPMIVVSVLDPTGLSMWTDSKDGRLPMETLITQELVPHIDSTYRTRASRESRGIEGFSMGGYGAAYIGFKYHELFSSVSILAAALHTPETFRERRRSIFDNVFGGDAEYARKRSPWTVVEKGADRIRGRTNVRIFVGSEDGLLAWNRDFHELLVANDIDHEWGVVPNAPHDIGIVVRNWEGDFFAYYNALFGDD